MNRSDSGFHPAQLAMVATRGSQCGYCTPGIVMSLFEATYREDMGKDWQVDDQLCGNLCRCTGYRPIREAGVEVAGVRPEDRFLAEMRQYREGSAELTYAATDGLAGPQIYLQPASLEALWAARASHPDAVLVAGGTDLGLQVTKHNAHFPVVIGLEGLAELRRLEQTATGWSVGAGVNLTRLMETVGEAIPALHKMLRVFGSRQIRSRATIGGNLVNASPIGDLPPTLIALDAEAVLLGSGGERTVPLSEFFTAYRETALTGDEILLRVDIPTPDPAGFCTTYKVSRRREMDISCVAAGMYVRTDDTGRVADIRLSYGGMSALAGARAARTEAALHGQLWSKETVEEVLPLIDADFLPIDDLRGSARYRSLLARNLLLGFYLESTRAEPGAFEACPVGTVSPEPR